ncbi:MAG: TIR domain-containing protein [Deltaproteobacteria bacterium]|nr:TIR domain-containing protein [Deltaproteobacteria bacterium]
MPTTLETPRVFISYSWSSPQHEDFIIKLSENLMSDGVNVVLDKWELREGHDKYAFMEQMVTDPLISKVIIISDQKYAEKADAREGGVGTESQIISIEVYSKVKQEKFIPVVVEFKEDGNPWLPTFLGTRMYINLAKTENYYAEYEKLIRNIYERPLLTKPKRGKPPAYLLEESPRAGTSQHAFAAFKEAMLAGKPSAGILGNIFLDRVLEGMEDIRFQGESEDIDEQIVDGIARLKPYRDQFVEYLLLVVNSQVAGESFNIIHAFLEKALEFNYPAQDMQRYNKRWFDHYKFFNMELFIYLAATLIRYNKYELLDLFLSEDYYLMKNGGKLQSFSSFNNYIEGLENRNKRLNLNRISLTADLIHNRADIKPLPFESIMQADFILCLRWILNNSTGYYWFPKTLVYKEFYDRKPFEIFIRATNRHHFNRLKKLLNITSKKEIIQRLDKAYEKYLYDWQIDHHEIPFKALMNLELLYDDGSNYI